MRTVSLAATMTLFSMSCGGSSAPVSPSGPSTPSPAPVMSAGDSSAPPSDEVAASEVEAPTEQPTEQPTEATAPAAAPEPMSDEEALSLLDASLVKHRENGEKLENAAEALSDLDPSKQSDARAQLSALRAEDYRLAHLIYTLRRDYGAALDQRAAGQAHSGLPPAWWAREAPCPPGATLDGTPPSRQALEEPTRDDERTGPTKIQKGASLACLEADGRTPHGPVTTFDQAGFMRQEEHFEHGTRHGPWVLWHATGHPQQVCSNKNGKLDGAYKTYYPTGVMWADGGYKKGLEHGTFKIYRKDGTQLGTYRLSNGTGTIRRWYESGALKQEIRMRKGNPVGDWTHYNEDGSRKK